MIKTGHLTYKLSANENPFGCSDLVKDVVQNFQNIHLYPDPTAMNLKKRIGEIFSIEPAQILCGCGSEDLLFSAIKSLVNENDEVLIPRFGFCIYDIAIKSANAIPIYVDYHQDMRLNIDDLIQKITPNTKLICIDNPGNPIGTYISKIEIEKLLQEIPSSIIVILDAAYCEYMMYSNDYNDGLGFVETYPNVIVTRTFSKAYGLAGLRIGWLYTSKILIEKLSRNRLLYKTTAIGQAAALAALNDPEFVRLSVIHNIKWLTVLQKDLDSFKLLGWETVANFVICNLTTAAIAKAFLNYLSCEGVEVLSLEHYGLPHLVRISIGNTTEMSLLLMLLFRWHDDFADSKMN